ncbi:tannase and feruloyl esterase [Roridomyces roridus]|uniref:Carboxylic ester hydrolase n=1 Tax=Roridomyces roridus TaxID=1738132 RepID=A0AAD7BM45_9AGAR|nr:tannase and feruloyl esterase [Roridomyces roridus]
MDFFNIWALLLPLFSSWYGENYDKCLALKSSLNLDNTTILDVSYVPARGSVKTWHAPCGAKSQRTTASFCRVQFSTETSSTSAIRAEAWLPDEWYGRFLAVGNGGLGGCIAYRDLDYGSAMHFATVASNNGHDGNSGVAFLGNPEVLKDFASRSIHTESVIGKQIVEAYYGREHDKSYYLGCSTGGRQGTYSALHYPQDFDGILAGAAATDFNHLLHWTGMLARATGAPDQSSPAYIPPKLWKLVTAEILSQCDAIDGVLDGMITEPDACDFRPEALICPGGESGDKCLSRTQVEAVRKVYSPLYGADGELIYPRFDPGPDPIQGGLLALSDGEFPPYTKDWLRYAVLNVSIEETFDFGTYGAKQGRRMEAVNPGGIATFNGDMSAFREGGGKFLTYHGRGDALIPSGNSKRVYNLIARTLGTPSLDDFYRLFLVPGMDHCAGGVQGGVAGASEFGQLGGTNKGVNASSHNILLALVDWVEGGVAPANITGTATGKGKEERVHCRYPMRSVWDAEEKVFGCVV